MTINKLLKNLSLLKSQSSSKQPIVLMLGGVFNPVHKQHIDTLEIAKKGLETQDANIKVVTGYISPCSDSYAKKKLGGEMINADQRIEMIKLVLEESDWIEVDIWEAKNPNNLNLEKNLPSYVVANHLSDYLNSNSEITEHCSNIKVMCVVGSDSCSGHRGRFKKLFESGIELVVVNREKSNPNWENECKKFLDSDFNNDSQKLVSFFDSDDDYEIRSTEIRNVLKNGSESDLTNLTKFLHPKVLEYIKKNKLFQEQFQSQIEQSPKNK